MHIQKTKGAFAMSYKINGKEIPSVAIGTWAWGSGTNGSKIVFGSKSDPDTLKESFDIAFLDPPYSAGILPDALERVAEHMKDTGVIIAENPVNEEILSNYGEFVLDRQYRYGKIRISTFRHKDFMS